MCVAFLLAGQQRIACTNSTGNRSRAAQLIADRDSIRESQPVAPFDNTEHNALGQPLEHSILAMASAAVGTKRSHAAMSEDSRSPASTLSVLQDTNTTGGLYSRQRLRPNLEDSCEEQESIELSAR